MTHGSSEIVISAAPTSNHTIRGVHDVCLASQRRFSEQFINLARQRINNLNPLKKKELVVCSSGPLKRLFAPIEIVGAAPYGLYVCIYARICVDGRHGTAERLLMTAIMTATTQWMAHSLIANFMWHRRRTWRAA
ncbi:uncharacterized protein LOC101454561 isoform X3 [Ceratitis capitata]|uniref:uncharacterized protein LOC101454561 isoform X3 n=1 Tax=Ceratitis capitata TaxID=7213 RepID=UPI00061896A6|nr:uncharacterized protein LOC101454561 isoform X3 [Ceratitis capitata]